MATVIGNSISVVKGEAQKAEIIIATTLLSAGLKELLPVTKDMNKLIKPNIASVLAELKRAGIRMVHGGEVPGRWVEERINQVLRNQRKHTTLQGVVDAAKKDLFERGLEEYPPKPVVVARPAAVEPASLQVIEPSRSKVILVRGVEVMLDRDVASALGVETGALNQNADRSPKWEAIRQVGQEGQYRFQPSDEEIANLRSQIVISNHDLSEKLRTPWVYTAKGCNHFGTSLNSDKAHQLAITLTEVFTAYQHGTLPTIGPRLASSEFALRRCEVTLATVKFLAAIPNYNPAAIVAYLEQSVKDLYGEGVNEKVLFDVSTYLKKKGFSDEEIRSQRSRYGKTVKRLYIDLNKTEPPVYDRFVDGQTREVNSYVEKDLPLFDKAFDMLYSSDLPLLQS